MKVDGKPMRSIWLEPDGWSVGVIDQTALPHRFATARLTTLDEAAHAIRAMLIRGAPLIGADRRLRHLPGAARRRLRRSARPRLCDAARHAADRDQSQMGARRDDGRGAQPAARRARRRRLSARRRDLRRGRRHQHRDRPQRPAADRGDRRAQEAGRAGQRVDPLQCRLAGGGRRRHRDGADLSGARQGHRRFTSSPTKPGRAIRALRSPPGSSASTACRTP